MKITLQEPTQYQTISNEQFKPPEFVCVKGSIRTPDYLEICVQDDGEGYPTALLGNHGQASAVSSEGTGLSLHLAESVVARHTNEGRCGEIRISNLSENNGAKFQLLLP